MRDLKLQLQAYQAHLDELYPPVTVDDVDLAAAPSHTQVVRMRTRTVRPLPAFLVGFALVIAMGVGAWVLSNGETSVPPAEEMAPTLPATIVGPSVPDVVPTTVPEGMTPTTQPAAVTSSTTQSTDAEPSAADIPGGPLSPFAWMTRFELDPAGGIVAVYWSDAESALRMLRCSDPRCSDLTDVVDLSVGERFEVEGDVVGPRAEDIAVGSGIPFVLTSGETYKLYACTDTQCDTVLESLLGERPAVMEPRIAIGVDGLPRVAYWNAEIETLNLIVCGDLSCDPQTRSTVVVHDHVIIPGQISIRIEPDGRTFIGYETAAEGGPFAATVAVCADDTCSTQPTIHTFEDAVRPRLTAIDGERFLVWYRSGPEVVSEGDPNPDAFLQAWDLMVGECNSDGCSPARRIEIGWKALLAWGGWLDDLLLLETPGGLFVAYTTWSPDVCATLLEINLIDRELGELSDDPAVVEFDYFTGAVLADGEPRVVYQFDQELRLIDLGSGLPDAPDENAQISRCIDP